MKAYKVVLFDLDHTLWDFTRNSFETLTELYAQHDLDKLNGLSFDQFYNAFNDVNTKLWDQYDRGLLDRDVIRYQRFNMVLDAVNIQHNEIAANLSRDYLKLSPTKSNLVSGAREVLDYLVLRYPLYIVTNGFTELQYTKVKSGSIEDYFKKIVTSEMVGHKKPAKEIFDYTLQLGGFDNHEAIMVGDNLLTDISGAANAGIDAVHFNPNHPNAPAEGGIVSQEYEAKISYKISSLLELKSIL